MTSIPVCWRCQVGLISWLIVGGAIACFGTNRAIAQIVPDGTLGSERSVVTPNAGGNPVDEISGGATRGANLFHSFEQFSVQTGRTASFNNAPEIQNIITRVTGSSISNIDGLIKANGAANLFLINPNGIIFGPNARLDIGGSFLASTASSVAFADGTIFSATTPTDTPLLTVSVPIGLQFGGNAASVINRSVATNSTNSNDDPAPVGLQVPTGKTLALVGGDVAIEGGRLTAVEGRIELGSVAANSQVSLTPITKGWALGYLGVQNFQDIQLSQGAVVDASGDPDGDLSSTGSGDIQVQGRVVTLNDGSYIQTINSGALAGGTLTVNASDAVQLGGNSNLKSDTTGNGNGGDLTITTGNLSVQDGAQVSSSTSGAGKAGNLTVNAFDSVNLIGSKSGLFTPSKLDGAAGDVTINTGRLIVQNGAVVSTSTSGSGNAGRLTVNASDSVELIGRTSGNDQNSGLFTQTKDAGNAGDLTVNTRQLLIEDGAVISTSTFGAGAGGTLTVNASELVELTGETTGNLYSSRIGTSVQSGATGAGGNLFLNTQRLIARDGARIAAGTLGEGPAGTVEVNALQSVELSGTSSASSADPQRPTRLSVSTTATGNAGNLKIATGDLIVRDGAEVTASSTGPTSDVSAGNIDVTARTIGLDNQGKIIAQTTSGNGGNIRLQTQDSLVLRNNSQISTRAGTAEAGGGNGGNITINSPLIVAVPRENSDIRANAYTGNGGRVEINANGIFGIQRQESDTPQSDITASSQFGVNGVVNIQTPDIDPSQGLVVLPAELVDSSGLIAQGCGAGGATVASNNKFIITGRGGLPPNPDETLSSDNVLADLGTPASSTQKENRLQKATFTQPQPAPIVEAKGWVFNDKGEVTLTALAPTDTLNIPWMSAASCNAP